MPVYPFIGLVQIDTQHSPKAFFYSSLREAEASKDSVRDTKPHDCLVLGFLKGLFTYEIGL
jgi:hypothetical protein